jgi:presenilin-like A22 family membrane protease
MLLAVAIALITLSLRYDDWQYANLSGLVLAIGLSSVFLFMFVTGVALAETVIFFAVGFLVLAYAYRMNKETSGGISWKKILK